MPYLWDPGNYYPRVHTCRRLIRSVNWPVAIVWTVLLLFGIWFSGLVWGVLWDVVSILVSS